MANENSVSLATFKPTGILEVTHKKVGRQWDQKQIAAVEGFHRQGDLFAADDQFDEQFRLTQKLPYVFSCRYRDAKGKESHTMIEDGERLVRYIGTALNEVIPKRRPCRW